MRYSEYEERKRALEEQLHADLELVRAGHQARVRALEALWLASPVEEEPPAADETAAVPPPPASETRNSGTQAQSETQAPPPVRVFERGEVLEEVEEALSRLPEVFAKPDLVRVLGYAPPRATLHRAVQQLLSDRKIAVESFSMGRQPTVYRKVP